MYTKEICCYHPYEINEITLLTIEEWEAIKDFVPKHTGWWWLRSPGSYSSLATNVFSGGFVNDYGYDVNNDSIAVRPAFKISISNLCAGDKILIGEKTICTVIDKDFVLADAPICLYRFDSKSNNYETSEIKSFINSDEFKEML